MTADQSGRRAVRIAVSRAPARLEGLTTRAALLLGFGLTLVLWLVAGYLLAGRIADVRQESDAINRRYMHAQELLTTVRAQVLLGAVYVRDALLDPKPKSAAERRRLLEGALRQVDDALAEYEPIFDEAFRIETDRGTARADRRLSRERVRRCSTATAPAGPIKPARFYAAESCRGRKSFASPKKCSRSTGARSSSSRRRRPASTDDAARHLDQLGFALAASLAIGLFAARYAGRSNACGSRAAGSRNARDLQRLSAQLITAEEEERRIIARELHDEVGQVLTAIKVELSLAERAIEAAGAARRLLTDAHSITEGAAHRARPVAPAASGDARRSGPAAAVDRCIRGSAGGTACGAPAGPDGGRLPPDTEATAFRIVQEALTNVARHARAARCRVYLQRLANTVLITVEDNGVGFDHRGACGGERRGLGLLGIRERVVPASRHGAPRKRARHGHAPDRGAAGAHGEPMERSRPPAARAAATGGRGWLSCGSCSVTITRWCGRAS